MANQYDAVNHVSVGDPTLKSHFDQLLQNSIVVAKTMGRVIAKAGAMQAMLDATSWAALLESYEFKLPATSDCAGITIRLVGYMAVEQAAQTGTVRLEYWDGAAWVAVASSALAFTSTTFTYLESVNLQANLFVSETRYRFTGQVNSAGQRASGVVFLTVVG